MIPDWPTLFSPRPLAERAISLSLDGASAPVWFAATYSADLSGLPPEQFLTPAEIARANAFRFSPPRENFMLGRLAAKLALSAGTREVAFTDFEILNGDRGEPRVHRPAGHQTGVSISHTGGTAVALAFPDNFPMGIDLEIIDASRAATVRGALRFSAAETAWLQTGAKRPHEARVLLLWAAREALGKLLGSGLAIPWEELELNSLTEIDEGVWECRYHHQPQYQCRAWIGEKQVLAMAFK